MNTFAQKFAVAATGAVLSLAAISDNSVQAATLSEIPLSAVSAAFNFRYISGSLPGDRGCPSGLRPCTSAGFDVIVSSTPELDSNLRLTGFSIQAPDFNNQGPGFPNGFPVPIVNAFAAPGWQVAEITPTSSSFQALGSEDGIAPGDFLRGFEVTLNTSIPTLERSVDLEVTSVTSVPEPSSILGLGVALGFGGWFQQKYSRNQQKAKQKA